VEKFCSWVRRASGGRLGGQFKSNSLSSRSRGTISETRICCPQKKNKPLCHGWRGGGTGGEGYKKAALVRGTKNNAGQTGTRKREARGENFYGNQQGGERGEKAFRPSAQKGGPALGKRTQLRAAQDRLEKKTKREPGGKEEKKKTTV